MKGPVHVSVESVTRCDTVGLEQLEPHIVDIYRLPALTRIDDPIRFAAETFLFCNGALDV